MPKYRYRTTDLCIVAENKGMGKEWEESVPRLLAVEICCDNQTTVFGSIQ